MTTRRFYAPTPSFRDGRAILSAEETRHLRDVLRQRTGDAVRVFDGNGNEFSATVERIGRSEAELLILDRVAPQSVESPLDLNLAVGLLKGEKFDLVVQKSVELGVTRIIPLQTARCEIKPKDTAARATRWRKIALEATKQCGRAKLAEIEDPIELSRFLSGVGSDDERLLLMFSERGGGGFPEGEAPSRLTALIGPEGGWDDHEAESARKCGFSIVTLRGRIMRAETAAISIAAVLQHRFGDLR